MLILLPIIIGASACNVTRSIPEGEYLLNKNIIKTDKPEYNEQLQAIIKQKPNKKILGLFRFHLGLYNFANKRKETKFNKWLKTAVGEEPVILKNELTAKSSQQLEILMQNNGYFNAVVTDTTIYRKKKAKVIYRISSGLPYFYKNIYYSIADEKIKKIVVGDSAASKLKRGNRFSNSDIQKERDRITAVIKNKGYFNFNSLYISFQADTSVGNRQVNLWTNISNPKPNDADSIGKKDSTLYRHQQNYFKEINVEMDYDPINVVQGESKDTLLNNGIRFIGKEAVLKQYKTHHFLDHIYTKKDSLYSLDDIDLTYRRLSELGIFRFVNIRMESAAVPDTTGKVPLKCNILLAPQDKQEIKLEGEATNNGGNFGVAGNIVYRNKNFLKGAETFTFKMKGGLELQQNFGDTTYESTRKLAIFNAYEIGPEVTLSIPRALWPFNTGKLKRISNPVTSISAGFNAQNRPEYFRQLFNLSYYYTRKISKYNRIYLYPAEINYLKVSLDPAFRAQLTKLNDVNLVLGYTDQFIANGRFSYVFNNQDLNIRRKYLFFRVNLEMAGNTIYLGNVISGTKPDADHPSSMFGVKFAQYLRPDLDIRYYSPVIFTSSLMVLRFSSGIGYAYGNSQQLPFEKSFFAGGPNDIRGWRTRQLGPGANTKEDFFERFGDFKITINAEYRFDIFRKLKGALFIDGGNIWLIRASESREAGLFKPGTFLDQMAIAGGVGLRFDFTFFIIRLDGGLQMKNPARPVGDRWVMDENKLRDITFNFGIGYPF
ncbi:MAG: BamA/TamA family outer membrane protein [Bacteroidia bacterium]